MNANTRKTLETIRSHPTPRELDWKKFVSLWQSIADEVDQESGDRLVVKIHGRREVFRRPNNNAVPIDDIERARHLLDSEPEPRGRSRILAVVIDRRGARLLDVDLGGQQVEESERKVDNPDSRGRHLRTVEKQTHQDMEQEMTKLYDELARLLATDENGRKFVVFGYGQGQANAARKFVERIQNNHSAIASRLVGVEDDVDLSATTDAQLEARARRMVGEG